MSDQLALWEQRFEWQADNIKRLEANVERLTAEVTLLCESLTAIRDRCIETDYPAANMALEALKAVSKGAE